jgi:hypothetical protein
MLGDFFLLITTLIRAFKSQYFARKLCISGFAEVSSPLKNLGRQIANPQIATFAIGQLF